MHLCAVVILILSLLGGQDIVSPWGNVYEVLIDKKVSRVETNLSLPHTTEGINLLYYI